MLVGMASILGREPNMVLASNPTYYFGRLSRNSSKADRMYVICSVLGALSFELVDSNNGNGRFWTVWLVHN